MGNQLTIETLKLCHVTYPLPQTSKTVHSIRYNGGKSKELVKFVKYQKITTREDLSTCRGYQKMEDMFKFQTSSCVTKSEEQAVKYFGHQLGRSDLEAKKENELVESTRAEMGEVREENQRLKTVLEKIQKDYKSLQLHFFDILKQRPAASNKSNISPPPPHSDETEDPDHQLVSLSLGRSPILSEPKSNKSHDVGKNDDDNLKVNLSLGLGSELHLSNDHHCHEDGNLEDQPKSKTPKRTKREEDDTSTDRHQQQNQVKRARVYVRARCDTPMMNDGCQWRKYGQKMAKGNPCRRAYYRCTVAPSCPVRKQVQRCAEDASILITSYEGTHNHPLPISATAMASTTSAAASMLLSGSSVSWPPLGSTTNSTYPNPLTGLSLNLLNSPPMKPSFNLPASISSPPLFPTITLDLTSAPTSSSTHFDSLASAPIFSSTGRLNFPMLESNNLLLVRKNEDHGYGTRFGALNVGKQFIQHLSSSNSQKGSLMLLQHPLPYSIAKD